MAETATLDHLQLDPFMQHEPDEQMLVQVVPETDQDYEVKLRAAQFIGNVLLGNNTALSEVEQPPNTKPTESLFDALKLLEDNPSPESAAYKLVETNVRTDRVERRIKAGHIGSKIQLHEDELGRIQQFGQTMESVQANSLRQASEKMLPRGKAEARNAFRIQNYKERGTLEDYYFVVLSPAADNMSEQELTDEGFFTQTMSCTIQATTIEEGILTIEPAFVAGKRTETAQRHDQQTIATMARSLGADLEGKTAVEILDTPLLVHKSLMPNGVLDMVQRFDEAAGGTFFGQEIYERAPQLQNYITKRKECAELEQSMQPRVAEVTRELIASAQAITTPQEACDTLAQLNGADLVREAQYDHSIDVRIFGAPAAWQIELSRWHHEQGDQKQAAVAIAVAEKTEQSSSCPGGAKGKSSSESNVDQSEKANAKNDSKVEDCEFTSKQCPVCGDKPAKTKVKNGVFYHVGKSCKG